MGLGVSKTLVLDLQLRKFYELEGNYTDYITGKYLHTSPNRASE